MKPRVRRGTGPSRRAFLGGAAATLGLPFLASVHAPDARADAAPGPVCLLWWFTPNGLVRSWPRSAPGRLDLPGMLAPLEAVRDEILLISGIDGLPGNTHPPHVTAPASWLTGVGPKLGVMEAATSVDQRAAARLGPSTPIPSLQLNCEPAGVLNQCDAGYPCGYQHSLSWADATTPLPPLVDPRLLFDRLFGGTDPAASAADRARRRLLRGSVLDVLLDETAALSATLPAADRRRLDRYTTTVRGIETRLQGLDDRTCGPPDLPVAVDVEARTDAFADLAALAFSCDLTRVVTFCQANGGSILPATAVGEPRQWHELSHHAGDPTKIAAMEALSRWQLERFAAFVSRLAATEDADGGRLLDRCLVVFGNEFDDGNEHTSVDLPMIVAGRANGAVRPGRHLVLDHRPLLDLHLSAAAAAGVRLAPWGHGTGPIAELAG